MNGLDLFTSVALSVISASTPLLLAATGELIAEPSSPAGVFGWHRAVSSS